MTAIQCDHETEAGKVQRRSHRQINAASRNSPGHADCDDGQQHEVVQHQARQVAPTQKARRIDREKQQDDQHQQRQDRWQQARQHLDQRRGGTQGQRTHCSPSRRPNAPENATTNRINTPCTPLTQKLEMFSN